MIKIHPSALIAETAQIMDEVTIGPGAILGANCCIDEMAIIGMGAIIGDQVHIGRKSIIKPGSVVLMNVPDGVIVAGNPAKCIGLASNAGREPVKYAVPVDAMLTQCRASECRRSIYWIITPAGKRMPVDTDGTPHFATCPAASRFRRKSH